MFATEEPNLWAIIGTVVLLVTAAAGGIVFVLRAVIKNAVAEVNVTHQLATVNHDLQEHKASDAAAFASGAAKMDSLAHEVKAQGEQQARMDEKLNLLVQWVGPKRRASDP